MGMWAGVSVRPSLRLASISAAAGILLIAVNPLLVYVMPIANAARYDRLAQEMGGPAAASIGFGTGIERLLLACDAEGVLLQKQAFAAVQGHPGD